MKLLDAIKDTFKEWLPTINKNTGKTLLKGLWLVWPFFTMTGYLYSWALSFDSIDLPIGLFFIGAVIIAFVSVGWAIFWVEVFDKL